MKVVSWNVRTFLDMEKEVQKMYDPDIVYGDYV